MARQQSQVHIGVMIRQWSRVWYSSTEYALFFLTYWSVEPVCLYGVHPSLCRFHRTAIEAGLKEAAERAKHETMDAQIKAAILATSDADTDKVSLQKWNSWTFEMSFKRMKRNLWSWYHKPTRSWRSQEGIGETAEKLIMFVICSRSMPNKS